MRILAWAGLLAAWLWSSGVEVAPRPLGVAWLFGLSLGALAVADLWALRGGGDSGHPTGGAAGASGRHRDGAGPRLFGRGGLTALAWLPLGGLLLQLVDRASEPLVDWIGPWLSDLHGPAGLIAGLGRLFGVPAAGLGDGVAFANFHRFAPHGASLHQIGLLHLLVLSGILAVTLPPRTQRPWRTWWLAVGILLAWLPLRFVIVTAVVDSMNWIGAHWQPLFVAVSYLPALWLIGFVARRRPPVLRSLPARAQIGAAVVAAIAASVTFGWLAHPPGRQGQGRVLIDDMHSDWEWSDIEFNTTDYGRQTTYNYYSFRRFLERHFNTVDVNADRRIDAALLQNYDVLILKTPTMPFLNEERDAIVAFVEGGGGLALIGDHTNLFGMTTYLNPIAEPFDILFRDDDTFDLTTGQPNTYQPARSGLHPAVAAMPGMHFETSCSIEPSLRVRPAMIGRALGSEPVDYSHVNFFGNIEIESNERWGVFLQAVSREYGRGRVFAFSDSTVFSNFSMFFRGKPELALGMVHYLNHSRSGADVLYRLLFWAGLVGLAGWGLWNWRRGRTTPSGQPGKTKRPGPAEAISAGPGLDGLTQLAAAVAGVLLGGWSASAHNAANGTLPQPHQPVPYVSFDSEYADFDLPTLIEESSADPSRSYDAFFTAVQRLDLVPRVGETLEDSIARSQAVVLIDPSRAPSVGDLERLGAWVQQGGQLLVLEPAGGSHLAANGFLEPFGMRIVAGFGERNLSLEGGEAVPRPSHDMNVRATPAQTEDPHAGHDHGSAEDDVARADATPPSTTTTQARSDQAEPTPRGLPRGGDRLALAQVVSAEGTAAEPAAGDDSVVPPYEVRRAFIGEGQVVAVLGAERFSFREMGPAFNNPSLAQRRGYDSTYWLFDDVLRTDARRSTIAETTSAPPRASTDRP